MTQAAPTGATEAPGFFGGVRCFWSGLVFLLKTPGAWPLALVPTVVVVALGSFFGFLAIQLVPPWVADLWGRHMAVDGPMGSVLGAGLQVIAT